MQSDPHHKSFWIVTVDEQQLELMGKYSNKLHLKEEGGMTLVSMLS